MTIFQNVYEYEIHASAIVALVEEGKTRYLITNNNLKIPKSSWRRSFR